jgi:hypothetical protein
VKPEFDRHRTALEAATEALDRWGVLYDAGIEGVTFSSELNGWGQSQGVVNAVSINHFGADGQLTVETTSNGGRSTREMAGHLLVMSLPRFIDVELPESVTTLEIRREQRTLDGDGGPLDAELTWCRGSWVMVSRTDGGLWMVLKGHELPFDAVRYRTLTSLPFETA